MSGDDFEIDSEHLATMIADEIHWEYEQMRLEDALHENTDEP